MEETHPLLRRRRGGLLLCREVRKKGSVCVCVCAICCLFPSTALLVEKEKPPMNVVGDVHGKIAILIVSSTRPTFTLFVCMIHVAHSPTKYCWSDNHVTVM